MRQSQTQADPPAVLADVDVAVFGAGPAGIGTALASSRNGARTILVEKYGFVGGNLAMGLPMYSFHDMRKNLVLKGIPLELVERLTSVGACVGPLPNGKGSIACVDPEMVKLVALRMLQDAGTELVLQADAVRAVVERDGVAGVLVHRKGHGEQLIRAAAIVDATGDGDIAASAGCPFEKGRTEDGAMQPASLVFIMGAVDTERVRRMVLDTPQKCECPLPRFTFEARHYIFAGFRSLVRRGIEEGALPSDFPQPSVIFSTLPRSGCVALNFAKVIGIDGTLAADLARGESKARRELPMLLEFLRRYIPGFEDSYFVQAAHQIGIRETRRITGDYVLTEQDLLVGRDFEDSVVMAYYPVDVHGEQGGPALIRSPQGAYGIPYRSLVPLRIENLLVAGRCLSSTREAQGAVRVMGLCMATGQAAGTAAALCVKQGLAPRRLDTGLLRHVLRQQGVELGR